MSHRAAQGGGGVIQASDLRVGDVLQSTDARDFDRKVRVESIDGDWVQIRNVKTGRKGQLRAPLHRWEHAA
jgi:hypothetical protein